MFEDLKSISLKIFKALFKDKDQIIIDDKTYPIEKYSPSGIKHVDIENYRFMEQNPKKNSHWADKARNGHKIMWVLKDWEYIGQVHNGKYKDFRE